MTTSMDTMTTGTDATTTGTDATTTGTDATTTGTDATTTGTDATTTGTDATTTSADTGTAAAPEPEPVRFDTKIAVLLRDDLEPWQRLNVTAFLVSGLGAAVPEVIGEPYADADGTAYLSMFRQPVLVFEGGKETLKKAHERALSRALPCAIFTADLFATGNDRDNRAAVGAVPRAELDLVGLAVYGPRNGVDKALKGSRMHP